MTICVLGAGAFGSSIAINLANNSKTVVLWSRSSDLATDLHKNRENKKYLPNTKFPHSIKITSNIRSAVKNAVAIIMCIPAQQIYSFFNKYHLKLPNIPIILCSKGIDEKTSLLQSQIVKQFLPMNEIGVLTGPSFANELADGLPTALTLACENHSVRESLQKLLSTPSLRVYSSNDVIGAQLGGALKNVIAIGCGMVDGAQLGESARIALMTRGFSEIVNLGAAMGGNPSTFYGLSGLGDLALTCNSAQSRNFSLGLNYARHNRNTQKETIEGIKTASAAKMLAVKLGIEVPIILTVDRILKNEVSLKSSIKDLLARPLKQEFG